MTQTSIPAWSQDLQTKLMAALDSAWEIIETSDDAGAIRKARDRARACGEIAAVVRKVAAMVVTRPTATPATALAEPAVTQVEITQRALDRLKGGRRGRL